MENNGPTPLDGRTSSLSPSTGFGDRLRSLLRIRKFLHWKKSKFGSGKETMPKSIQQMRVVEPVWNNTSGRRSKRRTQRRFVSNRISTTKYSALTFLPVNLWEQFHRWANVYFLAIAGMNLVPCFGVYNRFVGFVPIALILLGTALKDLIEDWNQSLADKHVNGRKAFVWNTHSKSFRKIRWEEIRVGDLVRIQQYEEIPADLLLLRCSDPQCMVFVETSNLDGETNLKQKQVPQTNNIFNSKDTPSSSFPSEIDPEIDFPIHRVTCSAPCAQITAFSGQIEYRSFNSSNSKAEEREEPIGRRNLLLRGSRIKSAGFVDGIVLFTGKETKLMLGSGVPSYKRSSMERKTNHFIFFYVEVLAALIILSEIGNLLWSSLLYPADDPAIYFAHGFRTGFFFADASINLAEFLLCYQTIIPLSLYIMIELIKLGQCYLISHDSGATITAADGHGEQQSSAAGLVECRALNIPEELGQIQFLLSDKTGTLTENKMIFRNCFVNGIDYSITSSSSEYEKHLMGKKEASADNDVVVKNFPNQEAFMSALEASIMSDSNEQTTELLFFLTMAICNTVLVRRQSMVVIKDETTKTLASSNERFSVEIPSETSAELDYVSRRSNEEDSDSTRVSNKIVVDPDQQMPTVEISAVDLLTPTTIDLQPGSEITEVSSAAEVTTKQDNKNVVGHHHNSMTNILFNVCATTKASTVIFKRPLSEISSVQRRICEYFRKKNGPSGNDGNINMAVYDGESTDELCLVKTAALHGVVLKQRALDRVDVRLQSPPSSAAETRSRILRFRLVKTLPFDSQRKCMSVLLEPLCSTTVVNSSNKSAERKGESLKSVSDGKYLLLCKGADETILAALDASSSIENTEHQKQLMLQETTLRKYSDQGLRTLCLAYRWIQKDVVDSLIENMKLMEDSSNLIAENDVDKVSPQRPPDLCSELEKNLIFLGITAIEDKIQNGVKTTIEALRRAGIRVWILTGDKLETALSVARCVHLFDGAFLPVQRSADNDNKSSRSITYVEDPAKTTKPPLEPTKNATLLEIRTRADLDSLKLQLLPNAFTTEKCSNRTSGSSLFNTVLSSEAIALLKAGDPAMVEVLKRSSSVLCYRMTPSEKATVVGAVQRYLGGKVMAIGDGANDVQMIRCANVGVGISGREGLQASMASDFSVPTFAHLQRLLLVHGHLNYHRLANFLQYSLGKNAIVVFVYGGWHQLFCGFSAAAAIDPLYSMFYPIVFTSVQSILFGIMDRDETADRLLAKPELYRRGRLDMINTKRILIWNFLDAVWQSFAIYLTAILSYYGTDCDTNAFNFFIATSLFTCNNAHLVLISNTSSTLQLTAYAVCALLHFGLYTCYCLGSTAALFGTQNPPVGVAITLLRTPAFWLAILFATYLALLPRLCAIVFQPYNRELVALWRCLKKGIVSLSKNLLKQR